MSEQWTALTATLATELSTLGGPEEVDTVLILSDRTTPECYVQFSGTAAELWAEVVSNTYLPKHRRLTPDDEQRLAASGWNKPRKGLPNWWTETSDAHTLATMVVEALRDQLRITFDNLTHESFRTQSGEPLTTLLPLP